MPRFWFKKLRRDNPVLAETYHRQCALDVAVELCCSEEEVHGVINGDGRDVNDAERITDLYWLLMQTTMLEHDSRELLRRMRERKVVFDT